MNIVVLNFSGNVGKSTITRHLLKPRLNSEHEFIEVETINTSNSNKTIRGQHAGNHIDSLLIKSIIFDVGSSNTEEFLHALESRYNSHFDIDYFIIPAVSDTKQIADTVNTIFALLNIGVDEKKIIIIPNRVKYTDVERIELLFSSLFKVKAKYNGIKLSTSNFILENEAYQFVARMINEQNEALTISDLANDITDYRTLIANETDKDLKAMLVKKLTAARLAKSVHEKLNSLYSSIFS